MGAVPKREMYMHACLRILPVFVITCIATSAMAQMPIIPMGQMPNATAGQTPLAQTPPAQQQWQGVVPGQPPVDQWGQPVTQGQAPAAAQWGQVPPVAPAQTSPAQAATSGTQPNAAGGPPKISESEKWQMINTFSAMSPQQRADFEKEQDKNLTPEERQQVKEIKDAINPLGTMTQEDRQKLMQGLIQQMKAKYDSSTPAEQAQMKNLTVMWGGHMNPDGTVIPPPASDTPPAAR